MSIRIQRLMINSFFLSLSRGSFAIFPSSILSIAQLRPTQPQTQTTTPLMSTTPTAGGVTLEAIMVQLVWMDACLDTLSDELCQVNTHGWFTVASSPSLEASDNESDDGSDSANDDEDDDDGSPSDDEMST